MKKLLATLGMLGFAATLALTALADDTFDVNVAPGKVVLTTHGGWHINKDYPWKLVAGDQKLDKSKFTLTETSASLEGAPKGAAKLKGAVCSGDQCKPFEKDLTIP
jgi:hypothetical protein